MGWDDEGDAGCDEKAYADALSRFCLLPLVLSIR